MRKIIKSVVLQKKLNFNDIFHLENLMGWEQKVWTREQVVVHCFCPTPTRFTLLTYFAHILSE